MSITAHNPWHDPHSNESRPTFSYSGRCLFSYRGVEVYKNVAASWDYVLDSVTITQRASFTRDRAPEIIDGLLDGTQIIPVSPIVAAHLLLTRGGATDKIAIFDCSCPIEIK